MAFVTCAALLAALSGPAGGKTLQLSEDCANVMVRHQHQAPLVIDAAGHMIRGFTVAKDAGNIVLRGGNVSAPVGESAAGPAGYAVLLRGARNVVIEKMRFTNFNRGIVTDMAEKISVVNNSFEMGQDGIIANGGGDLEFSHNDFKAVSFVPSRCQLAGKVETGLSSKACTGKGGNWTDGWHQDAIQLRNGIQGVRVVGNTIAGVQQGIGQMAARTDTPMNNIVIRDNQVSVTGYHSITVTNSTNVQIVANSVTQETGLKTIIRHSPDARVCGNKTMSPDHPGSQPC